MIKYLTIISLLIMAASWKWPEDTKEPPTLELNTESNLEGKVILKNCLYFNLNIIIHDLKGVTSYYISYNTEADITVIQENRSTYGNGRGEINAVIVPKKSETISGTIRDYSKFDPKILYTFKIEIEIVDEVEY